MLNQVCSKIDEILLGGRIEILPPDAKYTSGEMWVNTTFRRRNVFICVFSY